MNRQTLYVLLKELLYLLNENERVSYLRYFHALVSVSVWESATHLRNDNVTF